ncbi:hypothetical protein [Candidatus Leptofilum sp.]|uniref:hypothetical protein n=1 Tax=Candidatus Leptofilum sp. TaxID=3241576 RepID=UPI003B5C975E
MRALPRSRFLAALVMLLAGFSFFTMSVAPAAANTDIDIEKHTNGFDADTPEEAPVLQVGDQVVWEYIVTNTGFGPGRGLTISVTDDQGVQVICTIDYLDVGESTTCYGYGVAEAGLYMNVGCVEGVDIRGNVVSDCDPSHYYGETPPPPPGGGEGCTPGYWKQEHHFDSWVGYSPTDSFDAVFGVSYGGTLAEAAAAKGGQANALARHAVAALLNASTGGVDYLYSTADVISMVQAAFDSGDYETTKDLFEAQNEQGCPLN